MKKEYGGNLEKSKIDHSKKSKFREKYYTVLMLINDLKEVLYSINNTKITDKILSKFLSQNDKLITYIKKNNKRNLRFQLSLQELSEYKLNLIKKLKEKSFNAIVLLEKYKNLNNLKIFHQTGKKDFEWVKKSYSQNAFKEITVAPYFFDMANYFQKSDLIISRAGATTIAELIASQKASLLVPFSRASDNHQVQNARELENISGAKVLLEEKFTPEDFTEKIFFFLKNRENISQMEKNLASLKREKVAEKISALCFELMESHS